MPASRDVARELAKLIRGEVELRDFPWLSDADRRALGALGMSMLQAGRAEVARTAFHVLIDFEPQQSVHRLMFGHAAALGDDIQAAYQSFTEAIRLAAKDPAQREVACEAFLARGDLLLRVGRVVEARADLSDAARRMTDAARRRSIEVFLAS